MDGGVSHLAHLTPLPSPSPTSNAALSPDPLPLGSITPRLWTRPLRTLSPTTSYGYAVVWFAANVLGMPLDPWQQWLVIHLGELLPDGRPRFRQVLVLVARQNGKTHLCVVLSLFWLFVEKWPLVFGTSTNLEQAAEPWEACEQLIRSVPGLAQQMAADRSHGVRRANGQQTLTTAHGTKYKIGAVSPRGGRGKSIDRIVGDELREHRKWDGYNAAYNAMNARPHGQAVYITNQGDDGSVVLNSLRTSALDGTDDRLGLFEWSAPDGAHPMDATAWAAANPNLGRRLDHDTIRSAAVRVSKPGADPDELAGFKTEMLCMAVPSLAQAIDLAAWADSVDVGPIDLTARYAACLDVAKDGNHITLAVAQRVAGTDRVRVEVVASWPTVAAARDGATTWVKANRPRLFGWFPGGGAAAMAAGLKDRTKAGVRGWPPRGVRVDDIRAEVPAVCMGFAQMVRDGLVVHSGQALLDEQVRGAERRNNGPATWVFDRAEENGAHVDAVYAVAGAAHLALTLPVSVGVPRIIVPSGV